jgi:cytochrome subunit of sulfide dehydrogenase
MIRRKCLPGFLLLASVLAAPVSAADSEDGRNLAATCAACHGTFGKSQGAAMPNLAGQHKDYLIKQMQEFKSGERPATVMHQLAKGFSDEQIAAMAEYFSKQKP